MSNTTAIASSPSGITISIGCTGWPSSLTRLSIADAPWRHAAAAHSPPRWNLGRGGLRALLPDRPVSLTGSRQPTTSPVGRSGAFGGCVGEQCAHPMPFDEDRAPRLGVRLGPDEGDAPPEDPALSRAARQRAGSLHVTGCHQDACRPAVGTRPVLPGIDGGAADGAPLERHLAEREAAVVA